MLALVVSFLALLVSGANFYLTVLSKKAALLGCVAAIATPEADSSDEQVFEFALSNTGKVDLLVREASFDAVDSAIQLVPELLSDDLPVVLKAGQVQLIKLRAAARFVKSVAHIPGLELAIEFRVFSSRGKAHQARKVVMKNGAQPGDLWSPFAMTLSLKPTNRADP